MRLARRITRDVEHRGRDVKGCIEQYTKFVKPAFDQFVGPSRRYADVIIPWQRGDNLVAIDLITEHIRTKLQQHHLRRIYPNLEVIPSNYQVRCSEGLHVSRELGLSGVRWDNEKAYQPNLGAMYLCVWSLFGGGVRRDTGVGGIRAERQLDQRTGMLEGSTVSISTKQLSTVLPRLL